MFWAAHWESHLTRVFRCLPTEKQHFFEIDSTLMGEKANCSGIRLETLDQVPEISLFQTDELLRTKLEVERPRQKDLGLIIFVIGKEKERKRG